ncbi:MAG: DinB family protein [Ruminococcaceae bacterium]|nr:DinB family protein [Oscillospiraceae bacterium]
MNQNNCKEIIIDAAERMLWELGNVIDCCYDSKMPEGFWDKPFCGMPVWRHVYHTLHSLDRWLINPAVYEPAMPFAGEVPSDLDTPLEVRMSPEQLVEYKEAVYTKVREYVMGIDESGLLEKPVGCKHTRFTLILGQMRHLHTHMGMLMGFVIGESGLWPAVLGTTREIPVGKYNKFWE